MGPTLVALTELDPLLLEHLLDSLAAVFPVVKRRGWPGVWFVEVDQREGEDPDAACGRVGRALDDLQIDWHHRVTIAPAQDLAEFE